MESSSGINAPFMLGFQLPPAPVGLPISSGSTSTKECCDAESEFDPDLGAGVEEEEDEFELDIVERPGTRECPLGGLGDRVKYTTLAREPPI